MPLAPEPLPEPMRFAVRAAGLKVILAQQVRILRTTSEGIRSERRTLVNGWVDLA